MAPTRQQQRLGAAVGGALVVLGAAVALHAVRSGDDTQPGLRYGSVARMAQLAGCSQTLRTLKPAGPAREAGDCTTSDGVRVQFRIFDNEDQATGWGSAMSEVDSGPVDFSGYGENWVTRVVDATRQQANVIFEHLT